MELSRYIREHSKTIAGKQQLVMKSFARALEAIPRALIRNAGFDATDVLNKLRQKHAASSGGFPYLLLWPYYVSFRVICRFYLELCPLRFCRPPDLHLCFFGFLSLSLLFSHPTNLWLYHTVYLHVCPFLQ